MMIIYCTAYYIPHTPPHTSDPIPRPPTKMMVYIKRPPSVDVDPADPTPPPRSDPRCEEGWRDRPARAVWQFGVGSAFFADVRILPRLGGGGVGRRWVIEWDERRMHRGDGDYSAYRCDEIFANTHPSPSSSSSSSTTTATSSSTHGGYDKRCMYASTCNGGDGLLLPFVFFLTPHNNRHDYDYDDASTPTLTLTSTTTMSTFARAAANAISLSTASWLAILSPLLLLQLTLLFRLLGSSADEYFTPSLSMLLSELGLPPRFAGATLLALGEWRVRHLRDGGCHIL